MVADTLGTDDHTDAVICDEVHHSIADSWLVVLDYFGFFDEEPSDRLLLGVTATPTRDVAQHMMELQVHQAVLFYFDLPCAFN